MTGIKAYSTVIVFCTALLVSVFGELQILTLNRTFDVTPGNSVLLPCNIQDLGDNKVIWKFVDHQETISDGYNIKSKTQGKYSIDHPQDTGNSFWNLQISNVQKEDQGHYQCKVNYNDISVTHALNVQGAPTPPMNTNSSSSSFNVTDCCREKKVSASCMPVCHPAKTPVNFDYITACAIDFKSIIDCGTDGRNHAGCCKRRNIPDLCLDFCYGVLPSSLSDEHLKCLNYTGQILSCLEEGHAILPGPPRYVSVVQKVQNNVASVLVSWQPPLENANLVKGYKVFYKSSTDQHYAGTALIDANTRLTTINQLKVNAKYYIYVIAVADHGSSQNSELYVVTITPEIPPSEKDAPIQDCCIKKGVSKECLPKLCTSSLMTNLDPAPILACYTDFERALQCLVGQRNHSACCARNGLPDVCLPLCAGVIGNLSLDYTACILRIPVIDACVQEGLASIPGPPTNITVSAGVTDALISWADTRAQATTYTVFHRVLGNRYYKTDTVSGVSSLKLTNLYPGTHYEVQITAANDRGSSLMSSKVVFLTYEIVLTTPAPRPPGLIHNETQCCIKKNVGSDCMSLCSYDLLTNGTLPMDKAITCVDSFDEILTCVSDGRDHTGCCANRNIPKTCYDLCRFTEANILTTEFITCALYTAQIATCYREGLTTLPRRPQNFTMIGISSHTVTLSWQQPEATVSSVKKYLVMYTEHLDKPWKSKSTDKLSIIIDNLTPNTGYYFQAVSVNENGTSAATPKLKAMTKSYSEDGPCKFMLKKNMAVKPNPAIYSKSYYVEKVDSCKEACEEGCMAVVYTASSMTCTLYFPKAGKMQLYNKTGADFYNKTCPKTPNITEPSGNWTIRWQNRTDCCNKNGISATCLPACQTGDFTNVYQTCDKDYNKMLACAADGRNHSSCCQQKGVPRTCLSYCWGQHMDTTGVSSLCLSYSPIFFACFFDGMQSLPSPPKNLIAAAVNSTAIGLVWEAPDSNCQTPDCHYVVFYNQVRNTQEKSVRTRSPSYTITQLSPMTRYAVSVIAINRYGSSTPTPELQVTTKSSDLNADISITQSPFPAEVGGEVQLMCNVFGPGLYYYVSWIRNAKVLRKGRQLKMSTLAKSQEGNYTCMADDGASQTKTSHFLKMMYQPEVFKPMDDNKIPNQNQIGILSCDFKGNPTKVEWLKDNKPVNEYTDFTATSKTLTLPDRIRSILSIYYVVGKAFGVYECRGTNKFGSSSGHVELKNDLPTPTTPKPVTPKKDVRECCKANGMNDVCLELCNMDINIEETFNKNPLRYASCVQYLGVYTSCASDGKDHSKCCTEKGVHPFCVEFCTGSVPSDINSIYMPTCITESLIMLECVKENLEFIPNAPRNLIVRHVNDKIKISWDPPTDNAHRVTKYTLFYQRSDKPGNTNQSVFSPNITHYDKVNLVEGVTYTFWMVAENEKGKSQPSDNKTVTVRNLKPSKPTNVYVSDTYGESVILRWNKPENHAVVTNYTILYRKQGSTSFTKVVTLSNDNLYQINNMQPNTLYEYQVIANGPYGSSDVAPITAPISSGPSTVGKERGPSTAGKQRDDKSSSTPLAIGLGLTVLVILAAGGAVAVFLYCRRKNKGTFGQPVSFENPQYGSRVQISGLPDNQYETSADEGFGYAPLHEDRDIEHRPTDKSALRDIETMDTNHDSLS